MIQLTKEEANQILDEIQTGCCGCGCCCGGNHDDGKKAYAILKAKIEEVSK